MKDRILKYSMILLVLITLVMASGCAEEEVNDTQVPNETEEFIYGNATVQEIDILILESFPVQINVVAKGYLPDGCTEIDQIITNREGNTFNVQITTKRPADAICTQAIVPFEEVISLDVYGLEAGVYEVDVNGVKGSFELTVDNIIPE